MINICIGSTLLVVFIMFYYLRRTKIQVIFFSVPEGIGRLNGLVTYSLPFSACIQFPDEGNYELVVKVVRGKIRLCRNSYNPEGDILLLHPFGGRKNHYYMGIGVHKFSVLIKKHNGQIDQIALNNTKLTQEAVFTFHYELS